MPRLTITVTEEQSDLLEEKAGDDGEYESKSEAVRDFIRRYEDLDERERERQREHERELAAFSRFIPTELRRYRSWYYIAGYQGTRSTPSPLPSDAVVVTQAGWVMGNLPGRFHHTRERELYQIQI